MSLWDILFPKKCIFCGALLSTGKEYACLSCLEKISIPRGARCQKCGKPLPSEHALPICLACRTDKYGFTKVYAPFLYQDSVKNGLYRLKFHGKRSIARTFAEFIYLEMMREGIPPLDWVCAIPMDGARQRDRGYNQSELIARWLAKRLGLPYRTPLKKKPLAHRQVGLSGKERRKNVKGAFLPKNERDIKDASILLVDDIFTTGATVGEASRTLLRSGANQVFVATVAVTPKEV